MCLLRQDTLDHINMVIGYGYHFFHKRCWQLSCDNLINTDNVLTSYKKVMKKLRGCTFREGK